MVYFSVESQIGGGGSGEGSGLRGGWGRGGFGLQVNCVFFFLIAIPCDVFPIVD